MKKKLSIVSLVLAFVALLALAIAPASVGVEGGCPETLSNPDGSSCDFIGYGGSGQGIYECTHTDGDTYVGYGPCFAEN